jgi:hypothetical protein
MATGGSSAGAEDERRLWLKQGDRNLEENSRTAAAAVAARTDVASEQRRKYLVRCRGETRRELGAVEGKIACSEFF